MKQNITLGEMKSHLSPDDWKIEKLLKWLNERYPNQLDHIAIGQMIEFLDEQNPLGKGFGKVDATKGTNGLNYYWVVVQYDKSYKKPELADALFEAVKEVLE